MAIAPKGPHRVRRRFDAGGRIVTPGEIVDVTEFRNAFQLVDRGYLVALRPEEIDSAPVPKKKPAAKKAPAEKTATKKVSVETSNEGE